MPLAYSTPVASNDPRLRCFQQGDTDSVWYLVALSKRSKGRMVEITMALVDFNPVEKTSTIGSFPIDNLGLP